MTRFERQFHVVVGQIDEMEEIARGAHADVRAPLSGWRPADHLEHLVKAGFAALEQIQKTQSRDGGPRLRLIGRLILGFGHIPRGRGRAPEFVTPSDVDRDQLVGQLAEFRHRFLELEPVLPELSRASGRAAHPYFGGLTAARWVRFLQVHQEHHLKIIRDIESWARSRA